MKIITEGKIPPKSETRRTTCYNCMTEFEFAPNEARRRIPHPLDDDAFIFDINCPICNTELSSGYWG